MRGEGGGGRGGNEGGEKGGGLAIGLIWDEGRELQKVA